MTREHLNLLINLAATDGIVAEKEVSTIHLLAQKGGFSKEDVEEMLKKPNIVNSLGFLSDDQKFENLYYLIQMMKSDGQVFASEIRFCERIAEGLGYNKRVVSELSSRIYGDPHITADRNLLMKSAKKFLK